MLTVRPVIHLIPHTHWDREWYLPRGAYQARLPAAVSDALDQLERDDSLRFLLDGQTILMEDYLELCPEERGRVERLALTGRLQLGPWYVLADQLLPSAEALVRNLLVGMASARALGADPMPVAYAPDAFGHPAVLPTLAHEFDIAYGVVWRGVDVPSGAAGTDLFRWDGPDGATMLTYHLPRAGYEVGIGLPARPEALARAWPPIRTELLGRAVCRHVALFVGADHHAMRRDLTTLRDALAALDTTCEFRISTLMEFFRGVERETPTAPVRRGELRRSPGYTWALQGVQGTRLPLKRANAALEMFLERDVEPLVAMAPGVVEHRVALVRAAWRLVLQNQFHDSLAGTVSDEAAREITGRSSRARAFALRAAQDAIDELAGHDPDLSARDPLGAVVVWNPAGRQRSAVVVVDFVVSGRRIPVGPPAPGPPAADAPIALRESIALETASGETLGVQVLHRRPAVVRTDGRRRYPRLQEAVVTRVAFRASSLPGCAISRFRVVERERRLGSNDVEYRAGRITNAAVSLALEGDGSFTLQDRNRERTYPGLLGIRHEADAGDAYTVHPMAAPHLVRVGAVEHSGEGGPLLGWLRAEYVLRGKDESVGVAVLATLEADASFIRWTVVLDNRARDHRVLADIPLGLPGPLVVGTPFGSIERGAESQVCSAAALEHPGATAPAHRYLARATPQGGLAVFQPGCFEYQWSGAGDLSLTLLRAIGQLSRPDLPERRGHAAWPTAIPEAQCQGRHRIRIAAMPIDEDVVAEPGRLQRLWEDAAVPPWGRWLEIAPREAGCVPSRFGSIDLLGSGLAFSACMPATNGVGVVLRCWNEADGAQEGAWLLERPVRSATLCRADERPVASLPLEDGGRRIAFTAAARAVVTIIVA